MDSTGLLSGERNVKSDNLMDRFEGVISAPKDPPKNLHRTLDGELATYYEHFK